MRIVAGRWRGRRIEAPSGHDTRPTSDRVREALFSSLSSLMGPDLGAANVLDAFAGSGALGLEALSRGASRVTFVESSRSALEVLRANIEALGARSSSQVVASDVLASAVSRRLPGAPFDLLTADPPYRIEPALIAAWMGRLARSGALSREAVAVYEHSSSAPAGWPPGFEEVRSKRYGSTTVSIAIWHGEEGAE